MTENTNKRPIRSFVRREGRLTAAQQKALETHWQDYGLDLKSGFLDFSKTFKHKAPLWLEIGFGMGDSLIHLSQQHPEINFVGIEVHRPGVGRLFSQLAEQNIKNVRVFTVDAIEVLNNCIANDTLERVLLLFPDPWHKKRHNKRRIVNKDFITLVAKKLQLGGILQMATDWQDYAEQILQVVEETEYFNNCAGHGKFSPRPTFRPITKFERRGQRLGHDVWDLLFVKT